MAKPSGSNRSNFADSKFWLSGDWVMTCLPELLNEVADPCIITSKAVQRMSNRKYKSITSLANRISSSDCVVFPILPDAQTVDWALLLMQPEKKRVLVVTFSLARVSEDRQEEREMRASQALHDLCEHYAPGFSQTAASIAVSAEQSLFDSNVFTFAFALYACLTKRLSLSTNGYLWKCMLATILGEDAGWSSLLTPRSAGFQDCVVGLFAYREMISSSTSRYPRNLESGRVNHVERLSKLKANAEQSLASLAACVNEIKLQQADFKQRIDRHVKPDNMASKAIDRAGFVWEPTDLVKWKGCLGDLNKSHGLITDLIKVVKAAAMDVANTMDMLQMR